MDFPEEGEYLPEIEADFSPDVMYGNMGDRYIEFRLGLFPESAALAFMSAVLFPGSELVEEHEGVFDLRFGIRIISLEYAWKASGLFFEQDKTRRVMAAEDRKQVLSLLVRAIRLLVETERPRIITMSTFDAELPEQALVKYLEIQTCLHICGYVTVDTYKSDDGRHRWIFEAA
jgi:hypothetical protein